VGEFVPMHVQVAVRAENNEIALFIPASVPTPQDMVDLELVRLIDKETELAGVLELDFKELFASLSSVAHNCTPQVDSFIIPLYSYPHIHKKKKHPQNLCIVEVLLAKIKRLALLVYHSLL
jgi:hypothetical protein